MSRVTSLAVAAALAFPCAALAREHDDEEWGYVDDVPADVSIDVNAGASVTYETFHDNLAPYGEWVVAGSYGRVWRPAGVYAGWRPYYDGRWEWTDEGWLWVSAEPWGWATYHYGRWAQDPYYGWVWVPGYQWAPAWVSWRVGGGYIGWAPLAPGFSVYVTSYPVVYDHWCFVPATRFVGVPVRPIAYVGPRVRPIWGATQVAPPRATIAGAPAPAWGGAPRPFVERQIGHPVAPVRLQPVPSPQAVAAPPRAGVVPVFRPDVARPPAPHGGVAGGTPGPARGPYGDAPHQGAAPSRGPSPAAPPSAAAGPEQRRWKNPVPRGDHAAPPSRSAPPAVASPAPKGRGEGATRAAPPAQSPQRADDGGRGRGGGGGSGPAPQRPHGDDGGGRGPRSAAPAPSRGGPVARGAVARADGAHGHRGREGHR